MKADQEDNSTGDLARAMADAVDVQRASAANTDYPNGYVGEEYVCHKRVRAARIVDWSHTDQAEVLMLHFGPGIPAMPIRASEVRGIEAGGYLVQYPDGYRSFSPAHAFEQGYSKLCDSDEGQAIKGMDGASLVIGGHTTVLMGFTPALAARLGAGACAVFDGEDYKLPDTRIMIFGVADHAEFLVKVRDAAQHLAETLAVAIVEIDERAPK